MFLLPESRYREGAACDREGGWRMRSPDLALSAVPGVRFIFLSWECLAVSTTQSQTGSGTCEFPGAPSHHGAGGWRWRPRKDGHSWAQRFCIWAAKPIRRPKRPPCLIERNMLLVGGWWVGGV